jgi:hypothetical protein
MIQKHLVRLYGHDNKLVQAVGLFTLYVVLTIVGFLLAELATDGIAALAYKGIGDPALAAHRPAYETIALFDGFLMVLPFTLPVLLMLANMPKKSSHEGQLFNAVVLVAALTVSYISIDSILVTQNDQMAQEVFFFVPPPEQSAPSAMIPSSH